MYKSVGIFIESNSDLETIPKLKEFFDNNYIANINIFTDIDIDGYLDMSNLSSFYMNFCAYAIVFTNVADFLQYQYDIVSKEVYVLTSLEDIQKNHLEKSNLSNVIVLTMKDGKIYAI